VIADQRFGQSHDVLGLRVEEPNCLDGTPQGIFPERYHLLRGSDVGEQWTTGDIDARVRRLRGQHDGHQQLIGIR
jgi:hypothetical protein